MKERKRECVCEREKERECVCVCEREKECVCFCFLLVEPKVWSFLSYLKLHQIILYIHILLCFLMILAVIYTSVSSIGSCVCLHLIEQYLSPHPVGIRVSLHASLIDWSQQTRHKIWLILLTQYEIRIVCGLPPFSLGQLDNIHD